MKGFYFFYKSPGGDIAVCYNSQGVNRIILPYDNFEALDGLAYREDGEISGYFDDFFNGKQLSCMKFDISLTSFQKKVFDVLMSTKTGETLTYGDVAKLVGCSSPRAVGQALKKNPVPILIPCHRVLGKNWEGGFAGETKGEKMDFKRFLLNMERNMAGRE